MGLRYSGSMCARQRGRLSLVGGGMKERFRLPRLSNRRGCRSQIKLSVSAFLSSSFLSSSIHSTISLPYSGLLLSLLLFISAAHLLSLHHLSLSILTCMLLALCCSVFAPTHPCALIWLSTNHTHIHYSRRDDNKGNVPIPITRLRRKWPTLTRSSGIKIDEAI